MLTFRVARLSLSLTSTSVSTNPTTTAERWKKSTYGKLCMLILFVIMIYTSINTHMHLGGVSCLHRQLQGSLWTSYCHCWQSVYAASLQHWSWWTERKHIFWLLHWNLQASQRIQTWILWTIDFINFDGRLETIHEPTFSMAIAMGATAWQKTWRECFLSVHQWLLMEIRYIYRMRKMTNFRILAGEYDVTYI